jgi:hypothetical protein
LPAARSGSLPHPASASTRLAARVACLRFTGET